MSRIIEIANRIKEVLEQSPELEIIEEVIIGDRSRSPKRPPRVHIFFGPFNNTHARASHMQMKTIEIYIVCVVENSNEPTEGILKAIELSSVAEQVILKSKNLGLSFVDDISTTGGIPQSQDIKKPNIFSSSLTLEIKYRDLIY